MPSDDRALVAVDIGTTEVRGVLAVRAATGGISYRAVQRADHTGLRAGRPVNAEATAESLVQVVRALLARARVKPEGLVLGVSGEIFQVQPRRGMWRVGRRRAPVRQRDLIALYHRTLSRQPLRGYQRVGSIERSLTLDGAPVSDPLGHRGHLLEVVLLELWVEEESHRWCETLSARVDLPLACVLVHPITTASLLLNPGEREQGAFLLDFGAAHTHLGFFSEGQPLDAVCVPFGSMHLGAQLARALGWPFPEVERLKIHEATLRPARSAGEEEGPSAVPQARRPDWPRLIAEVLEHHWLPAVREAVDMRGGAAAFPGGIVLAGQGAQLSGFGGWVGQALQLPVRRGGVSGPRFPADVQHGALCTVLGLTTYAFEKRADPAGLGMSWLEILQEWWESRRG